MSKGYSSKKSARAYTPCCYSSSNVKIHDANLLNNSTNSNSNQYLISPNDVVIDTKNYYFEKFHDDNYLLTSARYGLRVCLPSTIQQQQNSSSSGNGSSSNNSLSSNSISGLFVRLELVDDRTNQEVICVKRERAGKRVLKGKTREVFDLSKHGNLKAKLDFRFRETSTDNVVEWFRLNVHLISMDNQKLLTFTSEPFRTSVRSPTKKTVLPPSSLSSTSRQQQFGSPSSMPPHHLNPTIVQVLASGGVGSQEEDDGLDEEDDDESGSDVEEESSPPQQKKSKSSSSGGSFPFLPPYQQPRRHNK